jgi:hypothetical protein
MTTTEMLDRLYRDDAPQGTVRKDTHTMMVPGGDEGAGFAQLCEDAGLNAFFTGTSYLVTDGTTREDALQREYYAKVATLAEGESVSISYGCYKQFVADDCDKFGEFRKGSYDAAAKTITVTRQVREVYTDSNGSRKVQVVK